MLYNIKDMLYNIKCMYLTARTHTWNPLRNALREAPGGPNLTPWRPEFGLPPPWKPPKTRQIWPNLAKKKLFIGLFTIFSGSQPIAIYIQENSAKF